MHFSPRRTLAALPLALALASPPACGDNVTAAEMRAALDEIVADGEVLALENEVVEITTSFTIADGVEAVIDEILAFLDSQIPCSTVNRSPGHIDIDFGALGDNCTYNGHTFAGVVALDVSLGQDASVVVDHTFSGFTNGDVTLDGVKQVVWTSESRTITTDYRWQTDERTVDATSDRLQTLLDPGAGLAGGIEINGGRHWTGDSGEWDLTIDGVEIRWLDPVPQAGVYTLTIPSGKDLGLTFTRIDENTIEARVTGGRRDRVYHITSTGGVSDQGEA